MKGKLPVIQRKTVTNRHREAMANECQGQIHQKEYTDRRRQARESEIKVGDHVLVKQDRKNKFSSRFNNVPYVVISRKGTKVTAENANKHQILRNVSHFKRFVAKQYRPDVDNDYDNDSYKRTQDRSNVHHAEPDRENQTQNNQRNQRLRRAPDRYGNPIPSKLIRRTTVQKGEVMS